MRRRSMLLGVLLLLGAAPAPAGPRYHVIDLGLIPGASRSIPSHFGAQGVVLGWFDVPGTFGGHAGAWTVSATGEPLQATDLGGLPGFDWSFASAQNSAGWIVGNSNTTNPQPRAVLWRNGGLIDIERTADGNANIYALDINDANQICGFMTKSGGGSGWDAVMWTEDLAHPGRFNRTVLPLHPSANPAFAWTESQEITATGRIFGRTNLGPGDRATWWENDAAHTPTLLEPLANSNQSMPGDCNDLGDAVGYTMLPFGLDRATRWSRDPAHAPSELPRWPGTNMARAGVIDPAGTSVLGVSSLIDTAPFPPVTLESHVVLWRDGVIWDLNQQLDPASAGWTVVDCADMNADGWIVATAEHTGARRAVLLLPVPDITGVTPTPIHAASLFPPSPNPSRSGVHMGFALSRPTEARLRIVDAQGRLVATPFSGRADAGTHAVDWRGQDAAGAPVAPGLYFAVLETDAGRVTTRIVRVR